MTSTNPLSTRNSNISSTPLPSAVASATAATNSSAKSLDYHRTLLQSKLLHSNEEIPQYFSPSDTIMSPCTAKLSAYKGRRFLKAKPQSLFVKAAAATGKSEQVQSEGAKTDGDGDVEMGGQ